MNEEGENPFVLNDDINSKEFKESNWTLKNKIILGASVGAAILILLIIIIIIVASGSKGGKNYDISKKIGEIICTYDYDYYSSKETQILSDKFSKKSEFDIYIGDKKIKYTKKYKFNENEELKVRFVLFGDINMDYMFVDLPLLLTVNMISEKNAKISSMISAFENCENLNTFNMV